MGPRSQGLFEVRPDRAFAANRDDYLTYTVLPDGANPRAAAQPRRLVAAVRDYLGTTDGSRI